MNGPASALDAIARVPCFSGLDRDVLERLAAHCHMHALRAGESVSRRGLPNSRLFVVFRGCLEVGITSRGGKRHVLSYLHPGEVFGLVPALDGGAVIHDADARGPTELLQIPHDALMAVAQDQPALLMRFLLLMCGRFRQLYQNFTFRQLLPLHERVVLLLMELIHVEPQMPLSQSKRIAIRMTQSDMADMLCLSRQSLSVELKKLEKSALIQIERAGITVLDPAGLERYADSVM